VDLINWLDGKNIRSKNWSFMQMDRRMPLLVGLSLNTIRYLKIFLDNCMAVDLI
jgi:hypothetical protein